MNSFDLRCEDATYSVAVNQESLMSLKFGEFPRSGFDEIKFDEVLKRRLYYKCILYTL